MTKRYGMLIDLDRCIGCHTCTIACKEENGTPVGVNWQRVLTVGGRHMDTPSGTYPNLSMHWRPTLCMHCQNPRCAEVCPTSAITRRDDGIVLIDTENCSACKECISACPYESPQYNPHTGVVEKCTFCVHRVDQGQQPFCVEACSWEARIFGDLSDPTSAVSRAIARKSGHVLNPERRTNPSVYYSKLREDGKR